MRWLLDTNVLIDAFAGQAHAVQALQTARIAQLEWIGYSAVTRLEILGFPGLDAADERGLEGLLAQFHEVPVSTAVIAAAIRVRRAVRIKIPDVLIAATALTEGAQLVTRNTADFRMVPGLVVLNPAAAGGARADPSAADLP